MSTPPDEMQQTAAVILVYGADLTGIETTEKPAETTLHDVLW